MNTKHEISVEQLASMASSLQTYSDKLYKEYFSLPSDANGYVALIRKVWRDLASCSGALYACLDIREASNDE